MCIVHDRHGLTTQACLDNAIKTRITTLLDMLEQCGLFVLRKGSIESYYLSADQFTSIGKPSLAVSEIDYLNQLKHRDIDAAYSTRRAAYVTPQMLR